MTIDAGCQSDFPIGSIKRTSQRLKAGNHIAWKALFVRQDRGTPEPGGKRDLNEKTSKASASRPKSRASKSAGERASLIVGVGASAGAIESLERYLAHLSPIADQANVIVLQHREVLDEQRLRDALTKRDGLTLTTIKDGAAVEGGKVYLSDADVILTVDKGRFRTRPAQQQSGQRGTIDSFFVSLAEDQGERAVAVILYGTSGSGTLGVAAFKEAGGLTIAERGPEQSASEIASSNSPGALADALLAPQEIPERIGLYARHLARLEERNGLEALAQDAAATLGAIATILRNKTGHDFHGYKHNTFLRRIQRRIQVTQVEDIDAYVEFLRTDTKEVQNLFNDLLIGVTQFFRDAKEFEVLQQQVIPKLFEGKTSNDQLRVWILGCATGEEAYSIAILLREHMETIEAAPHIQIFATDIDGRALAAARVGRYMASISEDLSPERLARWFVKEGSIHTRSPRNCARCASSPRIMSFAMRRSRGSISSRAVIC